LSRRLAAQLAAPVGVEKARTVAVAAKLTVVVKMLARIGAPGWCRRRRGDSVFGQAADFATSVGAEQTGAVAVGAEVTAGDVEFLGLIV